MNAIGFFLQGPILKFCDSNSIVYISVLMRKKIHRFHGNVHHSLSDLWFLLGLSTPMSRTSEVGKCRKDASIVFSTWQIKQSLKIKPECLCLNIKGWVVGRHWKVNYWNHFTCENREATCLVNLPVKVSVARQGPQHSIFDSKAFDVSATLRLSCTNG